MNLLKVLPAAYLVVSGHTLLFLAKAIGDYQLLGQTLTTRPAVFDSGGSGLGYPGGKSGMLNNILVKIGVGPCKLTGVEPLLVKLPRPMINQKNYNFSFSGLKTAILYLHQKQTEEVKKSPEYRAAMSHEIQQAIVDVLVSKTNRAAQEFGVKSIIIGGGVSANQVLRNEMKKAAKELKVKFLAPSADLSVDNAAMAGVAGYFLEAKWDCHQPRRSGFEPNLCIN